MGGFILVIISAFFHAVWHSSLKRSAAKNWFNCYMQIISVVILTPIMLIFYQEEVVWDSVAIMSGLVAGFFFTIYQALVAKAYQIADVSQVYPIAMSSPIFVTVLAALFLHEHIRIIGFSGILITLCGCYIMNSTFHKEGVATPASLPKLAGNKIHPGVIYAFTAAFFYSFGALCDKVGVNTGKPVLYTYAMNAFQTLFLAIYYFVKYGKTERAERKEYGLVLFAAFALVASSLLYRFGIRDMYVSYGIAIRQASALFGLAIGVLIFKESCGIRRIAGTVVIVAGIVLLRLSM